MANNAVLQRGFDLPNKTYKEQNLIVPDFDWISFFIIISLWVLGTVFVSKTGNQLFPRYNRKTKTFFIIMEILAQLLFISIVLFIYQGYIFYPIKEILTSWRISQNSLSSHVLRKLIDGFNVYYKYMKFSFIKSIFLLIQLSLNYLWKNLRF